MQSRRTIATLLFFSAISCAERIDLSDHTTKSNPSQDWKELLNSAVGENEEKGLVDYKKIIAERQTLERYVAWVADHGPEMDHMRESKEDRRLAFLLNAHNAVVIHAVLRAGDIQSVLEVERTLFPWQGGGFFSGQHYRVDGDWLSLNMLVEQSIVGRYQDPLLHTGLTKGCKGSPPLRWWSSNSLQSQLTKNLRRWLKSPNGMAKDGEDGFKVNALFHEQKDDFLYWSQAETLCEWLLPYVGSKRKDWFEANSEDCTLGTIAIDWALNAQEG